MSTINYTITIRPARDDERPFLYRVYASTRQAEVAQTGWSAVEQEAFLMQQFEFQDQHYRRYDPPPLFGIIEADGQPIGRWYNQTTEQTHQLMDIALLPEWRGQGIGGKLIRDLVDRADREGRAISLYVERFNPAYRLYVRLGFREIEENGVYRLMRREQGGASGRETSL